MSYLVWLFVVGRSLLSSLGCNVSGKYNIGESYLVIPDIVGPEMRHKFSHHLKAKNWRPKFSNLLDGWRWRWGAPAETASSGADGL